MRGLVSARGLLLSRLLVSFLPVSADAGARDVFLLSVLPSWQPARQLLCQGRTPRPGGHRAAGNPTAESGTGLWREPLSPITLPLGCVDLKETPDLVCSLGLSLNQHLPAMVWRAPPLPVSIRQRFSQRRDTRIPGGRESPIDFGLQDEVMGLGSECILQIQ